MTSNSAPPAAESSRKPAAPPADAYLVLHRGSRWTDVYRLAAPDEVVVGRSSENQVVLRSSRASRRHARLFFHDGRWFAEDLASRNGVFVNGQRTNGVIQLSEADRLQVAGFELRFTYDLALWSAAPPVDSDAAARDEEQATQDDLGRDVDGTFDEESEDAADPPWLASITRPTSAPYQAARSTPQPGSSGDPAPDLSLLQMAFAMGRLECPAGDLHLISELLIETLAATLPDTEIGLYFFESDRDLPMPRHVRQRPGHRYRRPPESLVRQIRHRGAAALLARNVVGDRQLATEDTRGEIDVESIVLVPLRLPGSPQDVEPASGDDDAPANALLHVTTAAGDRSLGEHDLTLLIAACEIFREACRSQMHRQQMQQSLTASQQTISRLRQQLAVRTRILGRSEPIAAVQYQITRVARSGAAVLLRGESGTGKELVASAIHFASERADGPMICLNCAALSKDLLESELFGHEKGAFTGATEQKIGKFEAASGGTLMLDEIGEMNLDLQSKLLRVLEGHPFERVGGQTPVRVNVRVIAATHRDLQAMVGAGTFRQDLFYRLNVIEIVVPPLRERGRDITLLANHFVSMFVQTMGRPPMRLSPEAGQKLLEYSWPGNVRELRNVIERAVVMAPLDPVPRSNGVASAAGSASYQIGPDDLLLTRTVAPRPEPPAPPPVSQSGLPPDDAAPSISLAELEQQHIERILAKTGGNKSRAAKILGIERSTLDRKLKRYD